MARHALAAPLLVGIWPLALSTILGRLCPRLPLWWLQRLLLILFGPERRSLLRWLQSPPSACAALAICRSERDNMLTKRKILLVDDDDDLRDSLQEQLAMY